SMARRSTGRLGSGLAAVDVGVELVALELKLAHPALHHVADAHDASQPAVLVDDGDVPEAPFRHDLHQLVDGRLDLAGLHVARHDRRDGRLEHGLVLVQTTDHVSLGDDSVDAAAVDADHQCADVVLGQHTDQLAYGRVRLHRHDILCGLAGEHLVDPHRTTSRVAGMTELASVRWFRLATSGVARLDTTDPGGACEDGSMRRELPAWVCAALMGWLTVVLWLDRAGGGGGLGQQRLLGLATWAVLL